MSTNSKTDKQGLIVPFLIGASIALVFSVAVIGALKLREQKSGDQQPLVTLAQFEQCQHGNTFDECCRILGAGEQLVSSAKFEAPGVGAQAIDTKAYQWTNPDGSNALLMFQQRKLVMKAQHGLK